MSGKPPPDSPWSSLALEENQAQVYCNTFDCSGIFCPHCQHPPRPPLHPVLGVRLLPPELWRPLATLWGETHSGTLKWLMTSTLFPFCGKKYGTWHQTNVRPNPGSATCCPCDLRLVSWPLGESVPCLKNGNSWLTFRIVINILCECFCKRGA